MQRILITGGAGLQGSRLARKLLDKGMEISIADNFSRGSMRNIEDLAHKLQLFQADLRNYDYCLKITKEVDTVFHLAAHLGGVEYTHGSRNIPSHGALMASDNLLMDTNIIRASVQNCVERFLYPSTACVYPVELQQTPDAPPLKEEDAFPANAESPYGWAKLMGEILCKSYAKESGIKVAIVRLFNVYGEGEDLSPGSHVIPELIRKAIRYPAESFVVYGDGSQTRAFTYVDDAVEGLIKAMEKYAVADPVNIGNDEKVSIKTLAQKIIQLSGKNIVPKFDASKPVGVIGRSADTTKARNVLRWHPQISLDEGLKKTYEWVKIAYSHHREGSYER